MVDRNDINKVNELFQRIAEISSDYPPTIIAVAAAQIMAYVIAAGFHKDTAQDAVDSFRSHVPEIETMIRRAFSSVVDAVSDEDLMATVRAAKAKKKAQRER